MVTNYCVEYHVTLHDKLLKYTQICDIKLSQGFLPSQTEIKLKMIKYPNCCPNGWGSYIRGKVSTLNS